MENLAIKLTLIVAVFAVGYSAPSLLQFDKKMEFVGSVESYAALNCQLVNQACENKGYLIELVNGNFASAQKTVFKISRNGQPVSSEVLVTSDDNLFGTIVSQITPEDTTTRQILIPYCGNTAMQIIVIDSENQLGLVINNLPQSS